MLQNITEAILRAPSSRENPVAFAAQCGEKVKVHVDIDISGRFPDTSNGMIENRGYERLY